MIEINTSALTKIIEKEVNRDVVHISSTMIALGTINGKQVQLCITDDQEDFFGEPNIPVVYQTCDKCVNLENEVKELKAMVGNKEVKSPIKYGDTVKSVSENKPKGVVTSFTLGDDTFLEARVQPDNEKAYTLPVSRLEVVS